MPEQHTDFIFTVAGEEFGFVGAAFVLALYALLLWRSIRIAFLSKDPFGTYLATGVAIMFAVQMFVNIGMVIGIMPIRGSRCRSCPTGAARCWRAVSGWGSC